MSKFKDGEFDCAQTNVLKGHFKGQIPRSNCIILFKVNIKRSRLDYMIFFDVYWGFYDLIISIALLPMTVKVIFKGKR